MDKLDRFLQNYQASTGALPDVLASSPKSVNVNVPDYLSDNPAACNMIGDISRIWGITKSNPDNFRWGKISEFGEPNCRVPISFTQPLATSVIDMKSEVALSLIVQGDEERGFGKNSWRMPILVSTKPMSVDVLENYKIDTAVYSDGERPTKRIKCLKDEVIDQDAANYNDIIYMVALVPVSNEEVSEPHERYSSQFRFEALCEKPAHVTMIQGRKVFAASLYRESPGILPLPNPVDKKLFKPVWLGDGKELIGADVQSSLFAFIIKPLKDPNEFFIKDTEANRGYGLNAWPTYSKSSCMMGSRGLEIGDVGVIGGRNSNISFGEGEGGEKDLSRSPRIVIMRILGVRQGSEEPLFDAIKKGDERFLLPNLSKT